MNLNEVRHLLAATADKRGASQKGISLSRRPKIKVVEARGVEPLSEWPSSVASPCSVSSLVSVGGGLRRPTLHPASCLISTVTRSPGRQSSLVVSSRRLPDIACETSRGLSRESELVRVHIYVFDPVINEANESSSACSSELRLPVETSTPPFWRGPKILPG